ncbi:MAG: arylsulfatase [Opitutales bacterium TMED158]|nr:MAG: arylsulfatase [Opitutales bacterium TMED158]
MRHLIIHLFLLLSAFHIYQFACVASAALPNVVLINADDLGFGDTSCYGARLVRTPHIDRLAREGRRFTDAHSASAVCSPSRYGLLTGRYPHRDNFWGPISPKQGLTIDPSLPTLPKLFQDSGYDTAIVGKWHLGFGSDEPNWNGDLKPGPLELGFDSYFGIPAVNSGPPFVYVENHRVIGLDPADPFEFGKESVTRKIPEKGGYKNIGGADAAHRLYVDEEIGTTFAKRAVEWIHDRDAETPFFLYLATTNIHHPFTPAPPFVGASDCGLYGDFIHELDWMVGQVLDAIEQTDSADNTLVIVTSDNGGMLHVTGQEAWQMGHRSNGKLLGYKFGAWEGGHRVPFIARWPGKIPPNTTSDYLLSQIDLFATCAAILGKSVDSTSEIDSLNQLETLTGDPGKSIRQSLVITPNSPKHLSYRKGDWVYIPQQGSGGFQGKKPGDHLLAGPAALEFGGRINSDVKEGKIRPGAPIAQLYDLANDPYQANNVYAQNPELVKALEQELQTYRAQIPTQSPIGWINLKQ